MDKKDKLFSNFLIKKAKVDNEERTFTAVLTSNALDRDFEILLPDGINKSEYMNNPVILLSHNQKELPIGKVKSIRKQGDNLIAKGVIAEGVRVADEAWQLIKNGFLKGISIGFSILEQRNPTPQDIKRFGKDIRRVISKYKLLEISVVSIPANQEALITGVKSLDLNEEDWIKDFEEEKELEEEIDKKEQTPEEIKKLIELNEKLEKELKEIEDTEDIEIPKDTSEKLVKVMNKKGLNKELIMKYFIKELKAQLALKRGQLFK